MELLPLLLLHQATAAEPTPYKPTSKTSKPQIPPRWHKIPTLVSRHSLSVTTPPSDTPISLNNIKRTSGSPIYDNGFLIIFGIENFFDLNFHLLILVTLAGSIFYPYFYPCIPAFYLFSFQIPLFDPVPKPDETRLQKKI